MRELDKITPWEEDFAKWYTDVVKQGNLMTYGNLKGSMIFKPISYGIWENIQLILNKKFKSIGIQNVYLPLLIPSSFIEKEKEHVKGFAPELATVTRVGDKELEDPLVIRPTSEVLFGQLFSSEVRSYKNLPILFNQWANVLRWEKTTNPFLRNREFLWQEGHTVHDNPLEARKLTRKMIKLYAKFLENYLAIPVIIGKKTPREKFAGAISTYTVEAMMKDGKALQAGTSHYLGQNFAKAFDISFTNKNNEDEFAYQTSWGVSTRLIGAIIMSHGDNRGVILPPKIAPNQIDILELFGDNNPNVKKVANDLYKDLSRKYRVRLDDTDKGPGFKSGKSEIEGTPLRIEIGPRDLENNLVTLVRRDTLEKEQVSIKNVKSKVKNILIDIQDSLLSSAKDRLKNNLINAENYVELKEGIENKKFVLAPFAGTSKEEKRVKEHIGATTRCIPFKYKLKTSKKCVVTGRETNRLVLFAKAY